MDASTLLLTALAAGAAAASKELVSQTVKDAYNNLKTVLRERFSRTKESGGAVVDAFEANPDAYKDQLESAIADAAVGNDPAVMEFAERLLDLLQGEAATQQKFVVEVPGSVQGLQIGDHGIQKNFFRSELPKK